MAGLTSTTIAGSYERLLILPAGGLNGTNLVAITDGDSDTASVLQIATTSALISGSGSKLLFSDNGGEYISGNGTNLTITSGNDIVFALGATGSVYHTGDGGTANTIYGKNAGDALVSGGNYNVIIGEEAGTALTLGDENVAVGQSTLLVATTTSDCVAVGSGALATLEAGQTTADGTVAIGREALTALTDGASNTAIGYQSLAAETEGDESTAVGYQALDSQTGTDGEVQNTAVGAKAGQGLTTGTHSTVVGAYALYTEDAATGSTAIGRAALYTQNAGSGASGNVGVGYKAGYVNATGTNNTLIGYQAGTGGGGGSNDNNTAVGKDALLAVTTGSSNTVIGRTAGDSLTTGNNNVFVGRDSGGASTDVDSAVIIGMNAGFSNMTSGADGTIAIGHAALNALTSGAGNVAIGIEALDACTIGNYNTAVGGYALTVSVDGDFNTAIGFQALEIYEGSDGEGSNTAVGYRAGEFVSTGQRNTFVGKSAGQGVTDARLTGTDNTAVGQDCGLLLQGAADANTLIGRSAGNSMTTGTNNTCIGYDADTDDATATNQTVIGYGTTGVADNSVTLGNTSVASVYLASGNDNCILYIGDTSNGAMSTGLTINQGGYDNEIIALKSSDVSHGMTAVAETDTYGTLGKNSANNGGLKIVGLNDTGHIGLELKGTCVTAETGQSTGHNGIIILDASLKSGTGVTASGSDANLVAIKDNTTTRFLFDAEGSFHADVESTTFDAYDDAQLVRAYDLSHGKGMIESKFDQFIDYNHETLAELKLVGREKDGTPNRMVNVTGMQHLHNGAIWQQYTEMQKMKELMYDTMVEMLGKEKADKKLKDHDIKLLDNKTLLN